MRCWSYNRSQLLAHGGGEAVSKTNENRAGCFAADRTPASAWCCITLASSEPAEVRTAQHVGSSVRTASWSLLGKGGHVGQWREMERAGQTSACPTCFLVLPPHPSPLLGTGGAIHSAHRLGAKLSDSVHFAEIHEEQLCHHFFCTVTERQSAPKATTASPSAPRGSLCQSPPSLWDAWKASVRFVLLSSFPYCISQTSGLLLRLAAHPASPPSPGSALRVRSRPARRSCCPGDAAAPSAAPPPLPPPSRPSGPGPTSCPLRIRPRPSQGNVCSARSSALPVGGEKLVGLCASWQSAGRRFCSGCGL